MGSKLVRRNPDVLARLERARQEVTVDNPERRVTHEEREAKLRARQEEHDRRVEADRVLDAMFAEISSSGRPIPPHVTAADLRLAHDDMRRGKPAPRPSEAPVAALARALVVSRGLPLVAMGPRWSPITWLRWLGYRLDRLADGALTLWRRR